jgi:transposase-like protein
MAMDMPRRPVELIPARDFVPAHCPWPECPEHRREGRSTRYRFHRHGRYARECAPRKVPRFRCLACGRTFSRQTFSTTYYAKRPKLAPMIAMLLQASACHRQIARVLGCAHTTVGRAVARLGRHCLLLLHRALLELRHLGEPVVVDHFESFEVSQDLPFGIGMAVGHRSWFVYALDPAIHGRGGRLTEAQKARIARRKARARLGGYRGSFSRLLGILGSLAPTDQPLILHTDGHKSYRRALAADRAQHRFRLIATPNPARGPKGSPASEAAKERDAGMYPSDRLHSLVRHTAKHHTRETIAFPRRVNAALERAFLLAVWRNFVKGRSERKPDRRTPAMLLGLTSTPWTWTRILARRLFPGHTPLPASWSAIYRRELTTPELGRNSRHTLARAF